MFKFKFYLKSILTSWYIDTSNVYNVEKLCGVMVPQKADNRQDTIRVNQDFKLISITYLYRLYKLG